MAATNRQDVEKEIKDLASVAEVAFKNISTNIKDIFTDALSSGEKVLSSLSKDMQRNINSLAKDSNNLIVNQSRINKGLITSKDINKQLLDNENKLYLLEQQRASTIKAINDDILLSEEDKLALTEDINKEYSQSIDYNKILVDKLKEQAEQTKLIEKRTGLTAKALMGLKKIPFLGDILNIDKGLENMRAKALETGNVFTLLGTGIKGAFEGIERASVILALFSAAKKLYDFIKGAMLNASKETAEFRRNMGLTAEEAEAVRQRTYDISRNSKFYADTQGLIIINQSQIVKSLNEANNALETQIDFTKDLGEEGKAMLAQDAILRDNLQLDEETRANIYKSTLRTGKTQEQITKSSLANVAAVGLQKNIMLDNNKILSKAAKTTGELRSSFHGNIDEIAKGIAKLKLMGLTLEDTKKVAGGLLNFEESISAELEAELLTGKDLNLERARAYALNRDYVNLGKELIRQGLTSNELANMNFLQLEAQAAVFSMSGDELTDMVYKQEEFNALVSRAASMGKSIQNAEKKSLQEIYDDLKKQQASEEQIKTALGDRLYAQKLAEDAQTKFNKALDQAKASFERLVSSGVLDKLVDVMTKFVNTFTGGQLAANQAANFEKEKQEAIKQGDTKRAEELSELANKANEEAEKGGKISGAVTGAEMGFATAVAGLIIGSILDMTGFGAPIGVPMQIASVAALTGLGAAGGYATLGETPTPEPGPKFAKGGITVKPIHNATMGEAGPEAIIPLHKLPEMLNINGTNDEAMNKMIALLSQQNTLLAGIKDKKSYIGINGTIFGTTQENNSFVVS
jgi:hypothetical protein